MDQRRSRGRGRERWPARVLVADDNVASQKAAVRMLESLGFGTDVSANGREAVEMVRLRPYDLVLMDCQMPLMDGLEAALEIRRHEPPERHVPIIAMSAENGADRLDRYLAAGVDDLLQKPIRMKDLSAALRRWLPVDWERPVRADSRAGNWTEDRVMNDSL